jgi:hypothetical protein
MGHHIPLPGEPCRRWRQVAAVGPPRTGARAERASTVAKTAAAVDVGDEPGRIGTLRAGRAGAVMGKTCRMLPSGAHLMTCVCSASSRSCVG